MPLSRLAGKKAGLEAVRSVWMFSYECAGIAQAGGLGEAVRGLAQTLCSDYGLKVTVILPSHGRQLDPGIREMYHLTEELTFIGQGHRKGTNGAFYDFLSGIDRGIRDNVEYVLVKGLDSPTSRWLDNPTLYDHDLTLEKMALFARTVKLYSEYLISMQRRSELPDLIHAHDWHMVPAGVAVKQHLQHRGFAVPLVYTVHLLSQVTLPWHYASADWCGIEDSRERIILPKGKGSALTTRQVWEQRSRDSLETFGAYEADYVTSVSESYLYHDVLDYVGNVIRGKSGHVYNGCDWDAHNLQLRALSEARQKSEISTTMMNRWDLRNFLLTKAIGQMNTAPQGDSGTVARANFEPFRTDGPLVLMTGRLSPQKGVDLLLDSVPLVVETVPTARFLLFLLPGGEDEMDAIGEDASDYPDNVRVVFGRHEATYIMSHLAGDVYAMPSRSEPFGISALEAMATGNPVVGSDVGGIQETVLDISRDPESGTGMLFSVEDKRALADSLVSLLLTMQIDEQVQRGEKDVLGLAEKIPSDPLRNVTDHDPRFGSKIRENCRSRVEKNFRWKDAGRMAVERYETARSVTLH